MGHTLSELASRLGLPMHGSDTVIQGVAGLEKAGPQDLSFLAGAKYAPLLKTSRAGAVILQQEYLDGVGSALISTNPYLDFTRALRLFATPQGCLTGQSDMAYIHPESSVDDSVTVYPFVFIGKDAQVGKGSTLFSGVYVGENCRIGERVVLYPNVVLMSGTSIGNDVIVHPGTVLGSDGFGYTPCATGLEKMPQVGNLRIDDQVEIGANAAIDRATLGTTHIGAGTKIDNLVQIGHNVEVGAHCILVSQVGVAGSSKLGNRVTLAGQVGIADHLQLGDDCRVGAKSGVNRSLQGGRDYLGSPAVEAKKFMRIAASWNRLPEMGKRLAALEKELALLKTQLSEEENEQQ
ncbi:UDP-3-O-[3-hydroxymyristoyl] glucosamine N-acyltransferase [Desulfonatronum thiosulfatophilum]|uniref:UDP-3-O-acylglucosamine N-acyltransferase n=1 Tax=Desulfonatronum thiosulfatophilum TaxID=617002 RepID=A0A1G6C6K4_9BACT|nr:UDP-3-O-(3-hydroxymyristoyl)glucosamine N-acyltransferase [Desulfonatronum thiosulfatophilum]SDB28438.1 UDP-3-O-[3-hydroxymyristoyl] glucosamine N-acyltransferase [Desulfonatronum thiosulfatophilum]